MPDGFVYTAVPLKSSESVSNKGMGRVITLTKAAIQRYIASFLDSNGANRGLLLDQVPSIKQYITDEKFEAERDITKRHLLLARYFNKLREKLPCLLILTRGERYQPAGLGTWTRNKRTEDGQQLLNIELIVILSVELTIGAQDEETYQLLSNALTIIFGPLRRIANGDTLKSPTPGDNWSVTLPAQLAPGEGTGTAIGDDPTDQVWTGSFLLDDVRCEISDWVRWRLGAWEPDPLREPVTGAPDVTNLSESLPVIIQAPERIRLGVRTPFRIFRARPGCRIIVEDPKILAVDVTAMTIVPKRLGTTTIKIMDEQSIPSRPIVLASHTITISL